MIGHYVTRDRHYWGGFGAFAARGIVASSAAVDLFASAALHVFVGDDAVYTTGTADDIKQVQTLPNPGSLGGTMTQGTAGNRPFAVQFAEGRALYFPGGGERIESSLSASAFIPIHDGTSDVIIGQTIHVDEDALPDFTQLWGTRGGGVNIGVEVSVLDTGAVDVLFGGDSGNEGFASSSGVISARTRHRVIYRKIGTSITLHVDGTQVASQTIADPSTSNPQHTLLVGARSAGGRPFKGWMGDVVMFTGANIPTVETLDAELEARHSLEATAAELVTLYAGDGLVHAFTPAGILTGPVRWDDSVGDGLLEVTGGMPTTTTLDGMTAIDLDVATMADDAIGVLASGTSTPVTVLSWMSVPSFNEFSTNTLWRFLGGAEPGFHAMNVDGDGDVVALRQDDFSGSEQTVIKAQDADDRFYALSYRDANDAFNAGQVDGTRVATPLNILFPVTTAEFRIGAPAGTGNRSIHAYQLLFDRALNVGEIVQWRAALQAEAS
jgi:hypothetical protein